MKKHITTVFFILFFSQFIWGQKLYVWCPDEQKVKPRIGLLSEQEVNLIVFDGRTIPEKSRVKCESKIINSSISDYILQAYPSAKITVLSEDDYYKKPDPNKVTIKIAVSAYHAGFGADISIGIGSVGGNFSYGVFPKGEWNALTSYYVQIVDLREGTEKKYKKEISELDSKSNMWGYKSAKTCLNTTYIKANQSLLFFIDNSLMD